MNTLLHGLIGIDQAWQVVKSANNVTLLTHIRPDGDGMSACAAFEHILRALGKLVETVYLSEPEMALVRQPKNVLIKEHRLQPDLIVVFDTSVQERVYWHASFNGVPMIVVDHHRGATMTGEYNLIVPTASSTCELLYVLLTVWDEQVIDQYVAECLMYGLLYDTIVFRTNSTSALSLRVGAELMDRGADLYQIKSELLKPHDPQIVAMWGAAFARLKTDRAKNVSWLVVTTQLLAQYGLTNSALGPLSNLFAELCQSDTTILFYEMDGISKASMRSKEFNVNAIAGQFGGGGHRNASGASSSLPIEAFAELVVSKF